MPSTAKSVGTYLAKHAVDRESVRVDLAKHAVDPSKEAIDHSEEAIDRFRRACTKFALRIAGRGTFAQSRNSKVPSAPTPII